MSLEGCCLSNFFQEGPQNFVWAGFEDHLYLPDTSICLAVLLKFLCVHLTRLLVGPWVCISARFGKHHLNLVCAHSSRDCGGGGRALSHDQQPQQTVHVCAAPCVSVTVQEWSWSSLRIHRHFGWSLWMLCSWSQVIVWFLQKAQKNRLFGRSLTEIPVLKYTGSVRLFLTDAEDLMLGKVCLGEQWLKGVADSSPWQIPLCTRTGVRTAWVLQGTKSLCVVNLGYCLIVCAKWN